MTLTNREAGNIVTVLSGCDEKGKLGYAIARNTRFLKDAAREFLDMKDKFIQEHGKALDASKGIYTFDGKAFEAELGDIADEEIEFSPYTVTEDVFTGGGLTSRQMENLMWMVKEA